MLTRVGRGERRLPRNGPEAMKLTTSAAYPDVDTLAAVIARSPIVVQPRASESRCFPSSFDEMDIAILEWIAAEGRRAGRGLPRM